MDGLNRLAFPDLSGWVEIACLALMFYYVMLFFRGTRGATVLTGFVLLLMGLIALTRLFRLDALTWLLERFSVYLAVAFLVIFQPEIRRVLAELGKQHWFGGVVRDGSLVDHVAQAVMQLAKRKIGALIAVERAIGTRPIQETGVRIDGALTPELLVSLFFPHNPLHDGGVIISGHRVAAAGCMFPLSQRDEFSKTIGTRHRAAVGLTEETDALVVVVSEETGIVSVSRDGQLHFNLDEKLLRRMLTDALLKPPPARGGWRRWWDGVRRAGAPPAEAPP